MKPRVLAGIVLLILLWPASVPAQFVGGSSFNGTDSAVATWSGKGSAASIGFAALGMSPPRLQNQGGVVQLVLRSSYACRWATGDRRWKLIPNSVAEADGLCQVLYYRTFQKDEHLPYRFLWFVTVPYDIRTYVISNVSGVDVASSNKGKSTALTASGVTTTEVGDYLMGFYTHLGSGTWAKPSNMGIAVRNDYPYEGPKSLNFRNLATQAWTYPASSTGSKTATVSGRAVPWVADLVAFKPLYRIPPQVLGDINPGSVYNGCKGKVTLSGGAGAFINSCVKSTSFCECRDTSNNSNACLTANPTNGTLRLRGTGADVELVNCL